MKLSTLIAAGAAGATLFILLVPRWMTPKPGTQVGYRAGSMIQFQVSEPTAIAKNAPPKHDSYGVDQAALSDTRPATAAYSNIQVLKDQTAGEFMTLHVAITNWVAPTEGCAFCHAGPDYAPNYASDDKPQKAAARTMIRMTQTLNTDWANHVAPSGVTCYTCHRGQNVPADAWYPRQSQPPRPGIARQEDWHEAASTVHDFFPDASAEEYLLQDTKGRIQSYLALPNNTTGPATFPPVIRLYEVMMQMSDDIGVNCGYCHNSRAFFDWGQSSPARWAGLNGTHMTQAINRDFLLPLASTIPQTMQVVGEGRPPNIPPRAAAIQNGNALANCGTCHYGSPKPLNGVNLVHDFPALQKAAATAAAPPGTTTPTTALATNNPGATP